MPPTPFISIPWCNVCDTLAQRTVIKAKPYYVVFVARRLAGASVPEASEAPIAIGVVPIMPQSHDCTSTKLKPHSQTPNPTLHFNFTRPAKPTTYTHTHTILPSPRKSKGLTNPLLTSSSHSYQSPSPPHPTSPSIPPYPP